MNITFFIGNGFDLSFGLNTKYTDFYEYYKNVPSDNQFVELMKEHIDGNYETWADLEIGLGEYTSKFRNPEDFETVLNDVRFELAKYIKSQEDEGLYYDEYRKRFIDDIVNYADYLTPADKKTLEFFLNKFSLSSISVNILTLNYSRTIERLLEFNGEKISIASRYVLNKIHHIHGFTDRDLVLGVNDITQIDNENFKSDQNILDALVKPESNKSIEHLIEGTCIDTINKSTLICIFGSSIGSTDKMWWNHISLWLKQNTDHILIIFEHNSYSIPPLQSHKTKRMKDAVRDKFLSQTNLSESEKNTIKNRILIGYNTSIFQFEDVVINV